MNTKNVIAILPKYHTWAYGVLFRVMDQVKEKDYFADQGLYFKSLHGTLNHLYMGDSVWYCRFANEPYPFKSVNDITFDDYATGKEMILKRCDQWIAFIEKLPNTLPKTIITKNFRGENRETPYVPTLMHVFNHATHHRGQISTVLTQLGLPAPEMDLLYYLVENNLDRHTNAM